MLQQLAQVCVAATCSQSDFMLRLFCCVLCALCIYMAHSSCIRLAGAFGIACLERACIAAAETISTQMSGKPVINAGFQSNAVQALSEKVWYDTCRSQLITLCT